jgi:hypothetical protein
MDWARLLAYITGTVDQELLLCNEYFAAENRILKAQIKGRLLLSDAERATLAEIGHRLGQSLYYGVTIHYNRTTGSLGFLGQPCGGGWPMRRRISTATKKKPQPKTKLGLPDLDQAKTAVLGSVRSPESQRGYQHSKTQTEKKAAPAGGPRI